MPQTQAQALARALDVARLLSSTLDLGELLRAVLREAAAVVDAETASVLLLDDKTLELYFDVALGLDEESARVRLKLGQGIAFLAQKRGVQVMIGRAHFEDSRTVRVETEQGQTLVQFDHAIVATGSKSALPKAFD